MESAKDNKYMNLSKLKRYLESKHLEHKDKDIMF